MRVLHKTASDVPPNLQFVLPATDTRSLLRTLAVLREGFNRRTRRSPVCAGHKILGCKLRLRSGPQRASKTCDVFFLKLAATNKLTVMHATSLLVGGGWNIQATSLTTDLHAWSKGFPASKEINELYAEEVQELPRDPEIFQT